MPATRSTNKQSSVLSTNQPYHSPHQASSSPSNSKRSRKPAPTSPEIIVLSSDDEPHPNARKATSSKKPCARSLRNKGGTDVPRVIAGDVLEISDSDGTSQTSPVRCSRKPAQTSPTAVKDLQRTIQDLQKNLKQSEKKWTALSHENDKLKRMHRADREELSALHKKPVLAEKHVCGLEDCISCEICTLKIWSPYMLPDCGHTFCQKCLVDWFSRTQTQYMNANPHHDINRAVLANQLRGPLHNLGVFPNPQVQNQVQAILDNLRRMQPEYTCPSCRKEVVNRPVEDFRLKAVVKEIAEMMGNKNSPKAGPRNKAVSSANPFDAFFSPFSLSR
ncbi:hypothetical protein F5I97DRAFT_1924976 [Phlebopus sp. FC_14]|nr:hypothetical protein F5I97DRAFT_1924976 [Phlebopus sp. FC_14]